MQEKQSDKQKLLNKELFDAVKAGDLEKIKEAIEKGADVDMKARAYGTSYGEKGFLNNFKVTCPLLFFAIRRRNVDVINLLLEKGARLDGQEVREDLDENYHSTGQKSYTNLEDHLRSNGIILKNDSSQDKPYVVSDPEFQRIMMTSKVQDDEPKL